MDESNSKTVSMQLIRNSVRRLRVHTLRALARLMARPLLITDAPALVVAPHPDDEAFGTGGLIARKRAVGARVDVVFMTDGGAAHRQCCGLQTSVVGDARRGIARAADSLLGIDPSRLHWLGWDDGEIPQRTDDQFGAAVEGLGRLIQQLSPAEVFCPSTNDVWADHEATTEITNEAIRKMQKSVDVYYYLVWAWHNLPCHRFASFPWMYSRRLDIHAVHPLKQSVIRRYFADQAPCGKPFCGSLPSSMLAAHQWRSELFFLAKSNSHQADIPTR